MLAKKMRTNDETSPGKMASERRRSKVRIDKLQSQIEELAGVLKDFRTTHLRAAARKATVLNLDGVTKFARGIELLKRYVENISVCIIHGEFTRDNADADFNDGD